MFVKRKETGLKKTSRALCAVAAALMLTTQVSAAVINYGNFSDIPPGTVAYTGVSESSATDPVPLYGAPTITGNLLDFNPAGFGASATNGNPTADITDGQLNFGFMTTSGYGLDGLTLSESGDYSLFGNGTSNTAVAAGVYAAVEITHINGVALGAPISFNASSTFTTNLIANPGLNKPWSLSLFIDFGPALVNAGYNPQTDFATKGQVVINDTLIAISEPSPATVAFIAKKDFKVLPSVSVVPEPGSMALIALGGLTLLRRRR